VTSSFLLPVGRLMIVGRRRACERAIHSRHYVFSCSHTKTKQCQMCTSSSSHNRIRPMAFLCKAAYLQCRCGITRRNWSRLYVSEDRFNASYRLFIEINF